MIGISDAILVYGCSLGESDNYIWREVGGRLRRAQHANAVLLARGLPNRRGQSSYEYRRRRQGEMDRFARAMGLAGDELDAMRANLCIAD